MLLIMFALKKLLGGLLMPLPLLGFFALIALFLAFKGRKFSLVIAFFGLSTLLAISTPFVANQILKSNEPTSLSFHPSKHPELDKIVVLGCDINPNPVLSGQDIFFYMNALNSSDGTVECDIIDLNGKKIRSFELSPNGGTYQIKNNLSKGLYFMQVNQGNKQLHCSKLEVI